MPQPGVQPFKLFDAVANAGTTLSKTLWPGTYTAALPDVWSGGGTVADILSGANKVGAVFSPRGLWEGLSLNFAFVGNVDTTAVVEVGGVQASGALADVIGTLSLKTGSAFAADKNPFTGAADVGNTWRLVDLMTITSRGQMGQLLPLLGGADDDTPAEALLDASYYPYLYVILTTLPAGLTKALCVATPRSE
jgi:hypothetical protein